MVLLATSLLAMVLLISLIQYTPPVHAADNLQIIGVYTSIQSPSGMTNTTSFNKGQTVIVWVVVKNSGSDLNLLPQGPIIWVEVDDPGNHPLTVQYHIGTLLGGGQTTSEGFSVALSYGPGLTGIPTGTYKATGFVSDKMISQGGSFIPSVSTTFTVS